MCRWIVEQAGGLDQRIGVECVVIDEPAGPRIDQLPSVGRLVSRGVRIRDDDDR